MSMARHHNEWLSLTEVSGPFLSLPVLLKVFPQGLDAHDPDHLRDLRLAHGEWEVNLADPRPDPAIHTAWIRFVLSHTLEMPDDLIAEGQAIAEGLKAVVAEHGETLRPDLVVNAPDGGKPRLLIQRYPPSQDLNKPVADRRWKASPATRMTELLHGTDIRLGLVTNGEHWMLVNAPRGDTSGYISWYATLWQEEHITLRAFRSLLCARRFFGVSDNETLEAMLAESAQNQQEVTDRLGYQVRRAVEVLVQSLDQADRDHGGDLLADVSEVELYNASLTIMMRLVFLFCAEERGLLLLGDPIFDQHYAVSTLRGQLRETADQQGEEILERRLDAWCRLLATFRAVHGGVQHEAMRLMAYGGHLFDPDRFPFLEGRKQGTRWQETTANPLPVNNRTVLHLLESLQILEIKVPGGGPPEARRLSFRALDIEQIGHVYEGLLDHTAKRATEPTLSLKGAKYEEPEIGLSVLEDLRAKDEKALLKFLKDQTKRSVKALKKALDAEPDLELAQRLRLACGNDEKVYARVVPFSGLVREDTFGHLVVIPEGSVYVTAGTDRRTTGTHYTPRSLTEPIVQYTLEPLVYVGPAKGKPKEQWKLKPAAELLKLKICDMAMGSGAFLVQACRYMSERLVESWEEIEAAADGRVVVTPEGDLSTGSPDELPIPRDAEERLAIARRIVADRCLYGEDINPMAVEMAKLSLWLITLDKHRPFTFLDHAFKCGDSLVGISSLKQLETFSFDGQADVIPTLLDPIRNKIEIARRLREQLEALPSNTLDDISAKDRKNNEADENIARLRYVADMLTCAVFKGGNASDRENERHDALYQSLQHFADDSLQELARAAREAKATAGIAATFHWPLEFPEVFKGGGFDAFVGNPPFLGGKRISTSHGDHYERCLKELFDRSKGAADLCCYFFRRAFDLLRIPDGHLGLLATKSIVEGDSRSVSLGAIIEDGGHIYHAHNGFRWPGQASVFASQIHIARTVNRVLKTLNGVRVASISTYLDTGSDAVPYRLVGNDVQYSEGKKINGDGFLIDSIEKQQLETACERNSVVLKPYINAKNFNGEALLPGDRWAIDFCTMNLEEARTFAAPFAIVTERVKPYRDGLTRQVHESRYWLYWDKREAFFASVADNARVLVCPIVTKYLSFRFVSPTWVLSHRLKVFDIQDYGRFSVLQSSIYDVWARQFSSSLGQTMNYSTSDAFDTFPLSARTKDDEQLQMAGETYYRKREDMMAAIGIGPTALYNKFHDPCDTTKNVCRIRELRAQMDLAVATAYGWDDLDLGHGFHETKQGIRFTISESARREVLARLLKLNHERYAEEVAQGLHDKKGKAKKSASRKRAKKKESAAVRHTGKLIEDEPTMKDFPSDKRFGVKP